MSQTGKIRTIEVVLQFSRMTQMTGANLLHTKWVAIKATVQSTWLWRVYCVCAMKRTWTKFMVAVFLSSWVMFAMVSPRLLTPVLELEQMHRDEGILLRASHSPRFQDSILIRLNTGEERTYLGSISGIGGTLEKYIGQPVTVWSQRVYEGRPPFAYDGFMEISHGERMLLDYRLIKRKQNVDSDISLLYFLFYLSITSLLIVGYVCRKGECAKA